MASFASIISIIVLLAVYGYSVPLESVFQSSTYPTSKFEFTTGKIIVDNVNRINGQLMTNEEAKDVPKIVIPRGFMDKYTLSTPATKESHERDSRESTMNFEKFFASSTPFTNVAGVPSSNLPPRGIVENNFLDTTTFRPSTSAEETVTPKVTLPKRAYESKEVNVDKSTSAEVFLTTPVSGVDSKESTSAERGNIRKLEATTRRSMGLKNPSSASVEVDRSSEESRIRGPTKVTPRIPIRDRKPLVV